MIKKIFALATVFTMSSIIFVSTSFAATHTVKTGESLSTLAKKYDTTVEKLVDLNDLKTSKVQLKQVIKLPSHIKNKPAVIKKSNVKKSFKVTATAYTAYCTGCSGITRTGINLRKNPNMKVIAVDPKIIPLGSKVLVEGYGTAIAGDTGSAIKGKKIDLFMKNKKTAYNWGRRTVTVTLLN